MAPRIGEQWQDQLRAPDINWNQLSSDEAIKTVEGFLTVPTNEGGIKLEFHQDGFDVEIEVSEDGKVKSVLVARGALAKART